MVQNLLIVAIRLGLATTLLRSPLAQNLLIGQPISALSEIHVLYYLGAVIFGILIIEKNVPLKLLRFYGTRP